MNAPMSPRVPTSTVFEDDSEPFDLRRALETLTRKPRLVLGVFFVVLIAGGAYALLATPVYQADGLIQVEEKKNGSLGGIQDIATALEVGQSPTAGELEILRSREVVGKAIAALDLDVESVPRLRVPYFYNSYLKSQASGAGGLARSRMGFDSLSWGGESAVIQEMIVPASDYNRPFTLRVVAPGRWELADFAGKQIGSGSVGVEEKILTPDGEIVLLVSHFVARPGQSFTLMKRSPLEAYQAVATNLRAVETARQSAVLRISYEAADPDLAMNIVNQVARAYLTQNVDRRSEEAQKSLVFLEGQLPELREQVEKAEKAFNDYRLARTAVDLDKESEALLARSVDLEKARVETELRQQDLSQRFQTGHPELNSLAGQLRSINGEEVKVQDQIRKLPETEQEFLRLQRDLKVSTDSYINLLNNAQQLKIAKAGTIGNVRVIDFAERPDKPVRPQRTLIFAIACVIGAIAGIAAAVLATALRPTIRDADEIERISGIPTYTTIPESKSELKLFRERSSGRSPRRAIRLLQHSFPDDPAIEAIRGMSMGLQFAMVGAPNRIVAITGPLPSVGKTFVSCNLAAILAATGKKILLVDADLRRPKVSEYFGLSKSFGLSNFLADALPSDQLIHKGVLPNLDVVCAGPIPPNPGELLTRPKLAELMAMGSRYDLVILDTPPILPVGDTSVIGRLAAATFVVLRAESSTPQQLLECLRRFKTGGIEIKGAIFNGVKQGSLSHDYGYSYYAVSER